MKTQSTQTPNQWISEPINYDAYSAAIRLADPLTGQSNGMGTIAHLMGSKAVKNAELIVRAVNSHETLLDAVRFAYKLAKIDYQDALDKNAPQMQIDGAFEEMTRFRDAIAQAEENPCE